MNIKNFIKALLIIVVLFAIGLFALLYFHGFPTTAETYDPNSSKQKNNISRSDTPLKNISENSTEVINQPVSLNEKFSAINVLKENNINYVSIDDSTLDTDLKQSLKEQAENLKLYGSFSKGKQTHEFKNTSYYKERLKDLGNFLKIKEKLNFTPSEIDKILGSNFELVGADYSGTYVENEGFDSVFRTYENNRDNSKIEINEMLINPANTKVDFYKENTNTYINSSPATIEKIQTPRGYIYNLSWINNQRSYYLSTQGLTESQVMQYAQKISSS